MIAALRKPSSTWQRLVADRIMDRLCEAARLVASDLAANRTQLRELLDELAVELDAGDLALFTHEVKPSPSRPVRG